MASGLSPGVFFFPPFMWIFIIKIYDHLGSFMFFLHFQRARPWRAWPLPSLPTCASIFWCARASTTRSWSSWSRAQFGSQPQASADGPGTNRIRSSRLAVTLAARRLAPPPSCGSQATDSAARRLASPCRSCRDRRSMDAARGASCTCAAPWCAQQRMSSRQRCVWPAKIEAKA